MEVPASGPANESESVDSEGARPRSVNGVQNEVPNISSSVQDESSVSNGGTGMMRSGTDASDDY